MKITDFVRKDNYARFSHYRTAVLYYEIDSSEGGTYIFTVDVSDLAGATANASEKSVFMMRYIRKALKDGSLVIAG